MSSPWPLLDGVARSHLASGVLLGRRVRIDVATDAATEHVLALLATSGAEVVADPAAELLVGPEHVTVGGREVAVPVLDRRGEAHGLVRAVLRLTNRRLPGTRVAVVGYGPLERELAGLARAFGGRVVVVATDPLDRLAACVDGLDVGSAADADLVFGAAAEVPPGSVLAGPEPGAVGEIVDEPRPGMVRVRRAVDGDVYVLAPHALASGRAPAWLDLMWTTRLVTLAWAVAEPGGDVVPDALRREVAAAALERGGAW